MNKKIKFIQHFMLTILFLVNVLLVAAQNRTSTISRKNTVNDKAQLLALEHSWLKAEFALDTAYLATLMDDSFLGISAGGTAGKHAELVDLYQTISKRLQDSILIDSFRLENTLINLYDNTAVVTFIVHTFRKEKGIAAERKTRFYDVWIKRNDQWKAVASQGTKVIE